MKTTIVQVDLGARGYEVVVGNGLSAKFPARLAPFVKGRKCLVVSDSEVYPLYGKATEQAVADAGALKTAHAVFKAGEPSKTLRTLEDIYCAAARKGLDRASIVVALGGGVVGDVAGFAAATYMRGIDFIQIPTSLLAMVDSSVGGKTGVDLQDGKNLVGAFWQPKLVLADTRFLATLPPRELAAGMAEVVKYGLILDGNFLSRLEASVEDACKGNADFLADLVAACCQMKADVVMADEKESGLRAILNFGHTFGHAIESATGYGKYLHGEAVAIGMVMGTELSRDLGLLDDDAVQRVRNLLAALKLPIAADGVDADAVRKAMGLDKKAVSGKQRFVVLCGVGGAKVVDDVPPDLALTAIRRCCD